MYVDECGRSVVSFQDFMVANYADRPVMHGPAMMWTCSAIEHQYAKQDDIAARICCLYAQQSGSGLCVWSKEEKK